MRPAPLVALVLALAAPAPPGSGRGAPSAARAPARDRKVPAGPFCSGDYADDLSALQPAARALEQQVQPYTYCVRTAAVYECPFYGGDGALHTIRKKVVAHGTAFGYRQQDGGTLLLTNDHVAAWPVATDGGDHKVEEVPAGCRRVSESLKIVDDDEDDYDRDDIPLTRVVTDPQLDVAVLRARTLLPVMPWRVGRSAALRERNVVSVRGFPLGALEAENVGKVISTRDHDDFGEWDHEDFVVDALLSEGSSGSPVFAISCRTGEFELVGVYHAAYSHGSALNVVVSVDQFRDLMTTLKRSPRPRAGAVAAGEEATRAALLALVERSAEPIFPLGPMAAKVIARPGGGIAYEVFSREFPARTDPILVLEEAAPANGGDGFGELTTLWAGSRRGLKAHPRAALDGEAQAHADRLLDALHRNGLAYLGYRALLLLGDSSKAGSHEVARRERALKAALAGQQELGQLASDLAERLAPVAADAGVPAAAVLAGRAGGSSPTTAPASAAAP
jgi:serine protease Do